LLRLYPRRFLARHGEGMRRLLCFQYERARLDGTAAKFLARAVADLINAASSDATRCAHGFWIHRSRFDRSPRGSFSGGGMFWRSTWMDVRYALRLFVRAPAFTGLAVS
jgi:hypothetical protein